MLTRGKFVQLRQIVFRIDYRLRDLRNHQAIHSALEDLAKQGFGTLLDGVFYKDPELTAEMLVEINVNQNEYQRSLDTTAAAYGFSTKPGLWDQCVNNHNLIYGKRIKF